MNLDDLEFLTDLTDELAETISGGQGTPPVVFQGGSSGVTTVANFNPNNSATQTVNNSFSNLTGEFPAFNVTFGSNANTTSIPIFPA